MIEITFDKEAFRQAVQEAVRQEMQPFILLLANRKLSMKETMSLLNIKSSKTIMSLVRQGKLRNVAESANGHPKFYYKEVMEFSISKL